MTEPVALLPFATAILSAALAATAGLAPRRSSLPVRFFMLVNASIFLWSLAYFIQLQWHPFPDPSLAPIGSGYMLVLLLMAVGISGSPTYWFLFSAASTGSRFWTSPLGIGIAHIPMVYTVLVSVTNPLHHLFMGAGPDGPVPGPLAIPHYVTAVALVLAGVALLVSRASSPGVSSARRRQGFAIAGAAAFALLGSMVWMTRRLTGVALFVNPTPLLFTLVDCVVAYQVIYRGLADIVPLSTLSAIMENTDAHLAYLGPDFTIVSVNQAFARESKHVESELVGHGYFEVFPDHDRRRMFEEAAAARRQVQHHGDGGVFPRGVREAERYWDWSLSPVMDSSGELQGFVLSLSDVTESVCERRLGRTLAELDVRVHRGFTSDSALREVVADAASALGCDASLLTLAQDGRWRIMSHCERADAEWEAFSGHDRPHISLAVTEGRTVMISDAETDDRVHPGMMRALGTRTALVVPFSSMGAVIGAISFECPIRSGAFTNAQVDFAERFASAVGQALENARLYESERRIAQTLQESMLRVPASLSGIDFSHTYRSATEAARVGGDFYDLYETDDGRIAVLIGDVSGHGIGAAVLTSLIKNGVRAEAMEHPCPSDVMRKVNEVLRRQTEPEVFATAFFGVLDPEDGSLTYCSAGHPPAMVLRSDGSVMQLGQRSVVLGVVQNADYEDGHATLQPDDLLVMYTDGLTEARQGEEFFGEDRLGSALSGLAGSGADEVVDEVFDTVRRFADDEFSDDVAMVALRRRPAGAHLRVVAPG